MARVQIDAEFWTAEDEAALSTRVALESENNGLLYESTIRKMLGKRVGQRTPR